MHSDTGFTSGDAWHLPVSIPLRGLDALRHTQLSVNSSDRRSGLNPLAGIRCTQTQQVVGQIASWMGVSIPLRGLDALRQELFDKMDRVQLSLNPLAGIRCTQTILYRAVIRAKRRGLNPLAGIRCTQTRSVGSVRMRRLRLNPLAGIRCTQTHHDLNALNAGNGSQSPCGD